VLVFLKKYWGVFFVLLCNFLSMHDLLGMQKPTRKTVGIFAHGLGGNASQVRNYRSLFDCDCIGVNGPEVAHDFFSSCLGQDGDIDAIVQEIIKQVKAGNDIIGIGFSKGAATWINVIGWLAENKPELLKYIKVLILDSPFAAPENVSVKAFEQLEQVKKSGEMSVGASISDLFKNYDADGRTPIKAVTEQWGQIKKKDMLIVLTHSNGDNLINIKDSRLLCAAMVKYGFKPYFIQMSMGRHGMAFSDPHNKVIDKIRTVFVKYKMFYLFSEDFFKEREFVIDDFGFADPVNVFCDGGVINKKGKVVITAEGERWLAEMRPYLSGLDKFLEKIKSLF